jgi:hypothetical protein
MTGFHLVGRELEHQWHGHVGLLVCTAESKLYRQQSLS